MHRVIVVYLIKNYLVFNLVNTKSLILSIILAQEIQLYRQTFLLIEEFNPCDVGVSLI